MVYLRFFMGQVVGELWRPAGGAYNVDNVLRTMVSGLEAELKDRLDGNKVFKSSDLGPSASREENTSNWLAPATATSLNVAGYQSTQPPKKEGTLRRLSRWGGQLVNRASVSTK